jgi:hypothetical protein
MRNAAFAFCNNGASNCVDLIEQPVSRQWAAKGQRLRTPLLGKGWRRLLMKALGLAIAAALALVVLCAEGAWGQGCQSGGGGGGTTSTGTSTAGTTTASGSSAQLLTGPGSWAYDVMRAQQVRAVYARRQAVVAAQKAAKDRLRKEMSQAVARERRQQELYRRSQAKVNAMAMK